MINLKNNYGPYFIIDHYSSHNNIMDEYLVNYIKNKWRIMIDSANNAERAIPILEKITSAETALIIVDMQKAFLEEGAAIEVAAGRKTISNINLISDAIRTKGGKVIFLRYLVNEKLGLLKNFEKKSYIDKSRESPLNALSENNPQFQLHPGLIVKKGDLIINKIRYSAVLGSNIVDILKTLGIKNVIVTGVTTDVCAGGTAETLMQMDFNVIMVWDGTAALDILDHELYLARIFGLYGDVMPTEEVLLRLK